MGPARALSLVAAALAAGCAGLGAPEEDPLEKLRRVGLEAVSPAEAGLPPGEAERFIPCRVLPEFHGVYGPEHPGGLLIVGVEGRPAGSREEILRAVAARQPGEWLTLTIQRNPHRGMPAEFYQAEVPVRIR